MLTEFSRSEAESLLETDELATLTVRQREVLELVARRMTNQEVAAALHITARTVKFHVSQILARLHLKSRHELARFAQRPGSDSSAGQSFP
jgi:DNA-binding NarL/FixJ family response regulator